ncbi:SEL1-like repeat protein [Elioraea rosea]|uniref:sel1 repeat family protein n=1 Tax=Elioraea rosea TaxID=2492390 RepID=UPI0011861381|nr:sel1 repeat family protein [Elioraea rosea]
MPPSLRAEADTSRPLGHARIVLRGVAEGSDLRFCILREGYATAHLGPRGWQVGEAVLEPASVESEGGAPVLVLSPALVRHVEPGPLTLRLPGQGRDLALFWPGDIPVYDEGDDALDLATRGPAPPPDSGRRPKTRDEEERERREREQLERERQERERERIVPPPPPPPGPPQPPGPRWPLYLVALLVVGAVAAGGAWWFLYKDAAEPAPVIATPEPVRPQQPTPPAWPEGTDQLSLQEVVQQTPNPEGILAVALRRQQAGRHDDALVLFEEAADRGIAPALTALGRLYDPNGFQPGRPFTSPDLRQAADYYRRAATAGDTQVLPLREALKTYLEQAAAQGNVTAAEALREFWP